MAYKPEGKDKKPILVYKDKAGKYIIVAGNFQETPQKLSVGFEGKALTIELPAHSFHTLVQK